MILMVRVDHRLLHGQVAYSWTSYLNADCILIANDGILQDELRKSAVKMAKPASAKLVIKNMEDSIHALNSGVTDKYRLLIIVETVEDAVRLADACGNVKKLNLGNIKKREGARQIDKLFNLLPEEEAELRRLSNRGLEIFVQSVPELKPLDFKKI